MTRCKGHHGYKTAEITLLCHMVLWPFCTLLASPVYKKVTAPCDIAKLSLLFYNHDDLYTVSQTVVTAGRRAQPHFQSCGPLPWSRVYPSTEKIDMFTQFGAVDYTITLYSSTSYLKSWGCVQILGRSGPPTLQWLHAWLGVHLQRITPHYFSVLYYSCYCRAYAAGQLYRWAKSATNEQLINWSTQNLWFHVEIYNFSVK